MAELLGDLRDIGDLDRARVQDCLRSNGYAIVSDSAEQLGLDQKFRMEYLTTKISELVPDLPGTLPAGRKRIDGAVAWQRRHDHTVNMVDYPEIFVPPGANFEKCRIYPNKLRIAQSSVFRNWMQAAIDFCPREILGDSGSIRMVFAEAGAKNEFGNPGKIVENIHRDDGIYVCSYPQLVNCGGAVTSLFVESPDSSGARPARREDFIEVASFALKVGDKVISDDSGLWHYVSDPTPTGDGTDPLRRTFIVDYLNPEMHDWMQRQASTLQALPK